MSTQASPPAIEAFDPGAVGKACIECGRPAWRTLLDRHLCLDHWANATQYANPLDLGAKTKRALREAVDVCRKWLYLPDPGRLLVPLAVTLANMGSGDPVWLLEVAASSSGKTELLMPLARLPNIYSVASLTEASLLSGTPGREQAKNATGGLLRQIGEFGIIIFKDFSGILSMRAEQKAAVLAALREVYDGSWSRTLGTDGGKVLSWQGKVGVIGAVTPAIDKHHSVMGSLGERFLLYRPPPSTGYEIGRKRVESIGAEVGMREEIAEAVLSVLAAATPHHPDMEVMGVDRLVTLATYVAAARTGVERDSYHHEVEAIPQAEAPGRLVAQLGLLANGLLDVGADGLDAWRLTSEVGWGCVPEMRRRLLHLLKVHKGGRIMPLASGAGIAPVTAERALDDLRLLGLVTVSRVPGDGRDTKFYALDDHYLWPY